MEHVLLQCFSFAKAYLLYPAKTLFDYGLSWKAIMSVILSAGEVEDSCLEYDRR